jgi:hypothetical protein
MPLLEDEWIEGVEQKDTSREKQIYRPFQAPDTNPIFFAGRIQTLL